ncbi:myosin-binding protein 1-like [Cucumis melo var. makuwa]|uniref:Myosin-binding protein 1-like n=1 Tax=Cucumis melo var. makuwa TaxID=1194695 RepID=A0A5D3CQX3_CUCMM|nr:myosin-binding protein 1-like [Cucumis melo var. makuwa]
MQRLIVGKLSDTFRNGGHGELALEDKAIDQGLFPLKSSLNVATKPNIPFHSGSNELRVTSDSELEVLVSEEEDDKCLIVKSALKEDYVLRSITQIPLLIAIILIWAALRTRDSVSINGRLRGRIMASRGARPRIALSSNGSVADHWDLELASWSIIFRRLLKEEEILDFQALLGKIADRSILKDQDRRLCSLGGSGKFRVKSLTIHLSPSSPMDKMINKALWKCNSPRRLFSQKFDLKGIKEYSMINLLIGRIVLKLLIEMLPPDAPFLRQIITLHHDALVAGELITSEETGTNNMGTKSPNEHEDHSTSTSTKVEECPNIDKVVDESSSEKTNDGTDHSIDSESSESDKECEVNLATRQSLESSSTSDSDHNSDSESSESDEKHKVNFATRQPLEKEADIVCNDMKQPPLTNTSVKECLKTDELICESAVKNSNDDMDHDSARESSERDKELEVANFTTEQPLEKDFDAISNDLKQHPFISTTIKIIDEVVHVSANSNNSNDIDHVSVSESFERYKEQEVSNFGISLDKEIDIVTDDSNHTPLINTAIEECPKTDVVACEFTINKNNDDMDKVSESSESDKEHKILNFSVLQSSEEEANLVANDLKQPPLTGTTIEECPKVNEVAYESAIKNINDDTDNVSESTMSDKEHEIFNFSTGQSSEKEIDVVANDLKHSLLINTTVEECSKTNEVTYEHAIKNINNDMDNASESIVSDKGHVIFNSSVGQSSEKETDPVTNDLTQSLLISRTMEKCPTTDEVICESAIVNTNDEMDNSSISESSVSDKQQEVFNFATERPSKMEHDIVAINDMEQFPLQKSPDELVNQSTSDDEGHNFSTSYDDLQEEFASGFNVHRTFHRSVSMESVESLDGSNVSEIEGESIVDRLKRQVEYDKKCIESLYKELEEERSASDVAASQAMAMITRLQDEKAAMHMEALHYLRMMEEQAEYDVEALEKANELLNEKERDIQDLEAELEYYRSTYMVDTIAETEHEKSDDANEESITTENASVKRHEYNGNYSFKSTMAESSKGSYKSFNNQNSSLEFEDEKIYIQLCLKSLEDKVNKLYTNGLSARVPNIIDNGEEVNPEQKGEDNIDVDRSQRNNEDNGSYKHIDQNNCNGKATPEGELVDLDKNGHFSSGENFYDVKGQISYANKREEVDYLALEHKISNLTGKLEALQAGYDFLEHSLHSLRYGEEGLQFAEYIVHQLQELCKLGIILDRRSGS